MKYCRERNQKLWSGYRRNIMKCPKCNGRGKLYWGGDDGDIFYAEGFQCKKCHGTGEIPDERKPLTNEEWFCLLTTREKATVIFGLVTNAIDSVERGFAKNEVDEIEKWLKDKQCDFDEWLQEERHENM